jgi:hypothetical protein
MLAVTTRRAKRPRISSGIQRTFILKPPKETLPKLYSFTGRTALPSRVNQASTASTARAPRAIHIRLRSAAGFRALSWDCTLTVNTSSAFKKLSKLWCTGEDSNLRSAFLKGSTSRLWLSSNPSRFAIAFPALAPRFTLKPKLWCTGEDSNLRSSKERQIYSLLPLTTRPPVRNFNKTVHTGRKTLRFGHPPANRRRLRLRETGLVTGISLRREIRPTVSDRETGAGEGI